MKSKITTIFAILILAVTFLASAMPATAAPAVHNNSGAQLNASQCNTGGAPLINATFKVVNDADSGVAGNAWAMDSYTKHVQVWAQSAGTYCAIVKYAGQFVTNAGASPQNTGTIAAGVKGTFEGGYQATFNGTFAPTMKTNGNIGTFDFQCDTSFNCPGYFDWVGAYFPGYSSFNIPYWAWTYHAGNNGSWVNASTGNSGDITGN
jgi:hypothetical protein